MDEVTQETQYPAGKYKLYVDTGYPSASHEDFVEIPEYLGMDNDEWNELSDDAKEKLLDEAAQEYMSDQINYGIYKVE